MRTRRHAHGARRRVDLIACPRAFLLARRSISHGVSARAFSRPDAWACARIIHAHAFRARSESRTGLETARSVALERAIRACLFSSEMMPIIVLQPSNRFLRLSGESLRSSWRRSLYIYVYMVFLRQASLFLRNFFHVDGIRNRFFVFESIRM